MNKSGQVILEAQTLSVSRGDRPVLRQLSFRINRGECIAIVGPNGAGKTTLMLTMLGLLPATSGRILLRGRDVHHLGRKAMAREMAYVPQQYDGFTGFAVYDMVAAGRFAHQGPFAVHSTEDRKIIEQALATCGLASLPDRIVSQLSGGERQKVWLAAAIAQQSPILMLDEPTTALDPHHVAELIALLRQFLDAGQTLILTSHDLNLAAALHARVLALRSGELVYDESCDNFLNDHHLRDVFGAEFHRLSVDGNTRVLLRV